MSTTIDPRAAVSAKAQIADYVSIGPFAIVEDDVVIGEGCVIGGNVLLAGGTRLGKECHVHHGAVIGSVPQDLKFRGEVTTAEIGDHTTVREYATISRGTSANLKTVVGHHCFLMAYMHIAHDCIIGNHVILANSVNMGGHVTIEDHVVVGGIVAIHQYCRIGRHAMIGGGFRVSKDVPPYILAGHEPIVYQGLNVVGLRRRNISPETIVHIEKAYYHIYHEKLNVSQAMDAIRSEGEPCEEVKHIIEFIEHSKRGIIPSFRK
jgi:UDP-N-acetylglucosamine acyltransferase